MNDHKILLVDDHELIINGIINLLVPYPRFRIIAHTENGLEVYNACRLHEPDIVILDLGLPGINGLDLIPQLCSRWSKMAILAYTAHNEEFMAIRTLSAGAMGYVLKNSSQKTLLAAIQTMAVRKRYIDPALNRDAINSALNTEGDSPELLTPRERQILRLIANSYTNRLIGEQLCISVKTVETHRLNIMKKLNVHKVTELLNCSRRLGLTD
ncbi:MULTISPECIES: two component system response regulator [unclassified Symbiopectobacterium]|uniref:two component system response regulator n=1 Tax=unclassified Symbiopectobacterium TaxID=2794573 RepID=UPI0022264B3C|nr:MULTISPECIES: two component system response regulator [unclassified Symbiopectobacterium]MCW2475005.1 two component system response regulator [Candidatus Symbiopectobacterium sp. NZEC151]MCW2486815.1 two component system response regulator [Candidatus Symbiopectobacterium sp. NZEC127]